MNICSTENSAENQKMDERLTKEEFIKIAGIIVCSEGEKII
jgi:hypothetical protein